MTKFETKFFDLIQKNIILVMVIAASILGVVLHTSGLDFKSDDFNSFLNPWWSQIKSGGINGLANQVGNYNIPYQVITYLLTLLPLEALHAYKLLSIIFDIVLAVSAGLLVGRVTGTKTGFAPALTYSLVFCSMTIILNSSFWAQCDSIYVAFILLAIYFTFNDRHILSFVMLGISLAFKLQVIFILPVFLYYYISTRKVSILHFLIIPLVDIVMCLPAIFLGRNPTDIWNIYLVQTDYGKLIQMNCPNLYAFMCNGYDMNNYYLFKGMSIVLTVFVLGIGLSMIIHKRVDLSEYKNFLLTAIWTSFTCLMLLSSMHERYGYLLDVLLIIYVIIVRKHYWVAIACNLVSLRGYCVYLFQYDVLDIKWTSAIYICIYAYVTYLFVKNTVQHGQKLK